MDGKDGVDPERVVGLMMWTDLEVDSEGKVSVNEFARCLRQQGVDVSNFMVLRIVSDGQTPQTSMDHELFVATKEKLITELSSEPPLEPDEKLRKYKANYLDLWKEHSNSKDETGEIPVSQLPNVVFAECNPTRELLDALIEVKSDASESLNFMEFCEMLENLPQSGMIDELTLHNAFATEDVDGSGYISRAQLYSLLIENGDDPLTKEEVDEMMEDCGVADRFKYTDWIQRVITIKSLSEK